MKLQQKTSKTARRCAAALLALLLCLGGLSAFAPEARAEDAAEKTEGSEALAEGDVITVTGTIKNYKGTIEFDKGCTFTK